MKSRIVSQMDLLNLADKVVKSLSQSHQMPEITDEEHSSIAWFIGQGLKSLEESNGVLRRNPTPAGARENLETGKD